MCDVTYPGKNERMRREINTPEFGRLEGNMWTWGRVTESPCQRPKGVVLPSLDSP